MAIIIFLGSTGMVGLIGMMILMYFKVESSSLVALSPIVGGAVGSLGTLLSNTRQHEPFPADRPTGTPSDPVITKVENSVDEAIPITPGNPGERLRD